MLRRKAQNGFINLIVVAAANFAACIAPGLSHSLETTDHIHNAKNKQQKISIDPTIQDEKPIFRYGVSGGVRGANQPIDKLRIFDSGQIVVTGDVGVPDRRSQLSQTEIQEFKDFLLKKNDFFNLNSADIEKRMNKNGATAITDGYSSIFSANFDGRIHEVEIYSLWSATKSFPNFEEIKKCESIEKRCKTIISKVNLGDRGPKVLDAINSEISKKSLGIEPFKIDEMRLTSQLPAGRFQVSFSRIHPGTNEDPPKMMHAIYFVKNAKAEPQISFYNLPK